MTNLIKMQNKVNALLSVFTTLIETLDSNIAELTSGIQRNKTTITALEEQNNTYAEKIDEYKTLAENVKGLINRD